VTDVELRDLARTLHEVYGTIRGCRRGVDVPAIDRALELTLVHLHDALWVMGEDVGLNPDFDAPVDGAARGE
jgi:hypothetical protein